jgi:hypothetical protein
VPMRRWAKKLSLDALLSNGVRRSGGVSSLAHAPSDLEEDPAHSTVFLS